MKEDLESHKFREDVIRVMAGKFFTGDGRNEKGLSKR